MTEIFYGFFSYAHADAKTDKALFDAFSEELAARLTSQFTERTQARLWRDLDIRTGEIWDPGIEAYLRDSKFLVVMLSPQWLASDYCRKEFAIFVEEEKKRGAKELIIPILVRDVESKKEDLSKEKRDVYEKLSARQFKSAVVTQFYKLTPEQRSVEIEKLAEEIYPRIKPFIKKPEPLPAPITIAAAPPTPAALPPHNLPLKSLGRLFMGRDAFMIDLEGKLQGDGAAAVTEGVLQGMGGVGKTRLAIEYAWKHAKDYRALLFVSAEAPETLATGLAALAATLNLPEQEAPQDPVKREAVLRWFARESGWLLILDNVDDETAAAAVAELLPQLANGVTLITARYDGFPANIETMPLGVLKPEPARDFLLARTKARRREAPDDTASAEELAKELGYLALALEQAGAFIGAQRISFERYLAYWRDERARVVDWFDKTAMGTNHDRGLAAVFATSLARLSPNGRRLLDRVAFLAPEPIPEFLLEVTLPSSFETPAPQAPQDEGSGAASPFSRETRETGEGGPRVSEGRMRATTTAAAPVSGPHAEEAPQEPSRSTRATAASSSPPDETFDARAALAELYAYSLAAPTEIEGRYAQPAFIVHRLVQDYARACMDGARQEDMLREALSWMNAAFVCEQYDVLSWLQLDPLTLHATAVVDAGDQFNIEFPTVYLMANLGFVLRALSRNRKTEPLYRRTLAISEHYFGMEHPQTAIRLNNLAQLLKDTNRLDEPESLMRRALEIDEKAFGPHHANVAIDLNNLAQLLQDTNRLDEAEPLMRRALEIHEKAFGPHHANVAIDLNNLAQLLQDTNRLDEAEPLMRRALDIGENAFGPDHPNVTIRLNNLAQLLHDTNRLNEAEPLMRRALEIDENAFGPDHPRVAMYLNNLARLLRDTNRLDEAEPHFQRALKIFAASLGTDHPKTKGAATNYLFLLLQRGAGEDEAAAKVAAALRGE